MEVIRDPRWRGGPELYASCLIINTVACVCVLDPSVRLPIFFS